MISQQPAENVIRQKKKATHLSTTFQHFPNRNARKRYDCYFLRGSQKPPIQKINFPTASILLEEEGRGTGGGKLAQRAAHWSSRIQQRNEKRRKQRIFFSPPKRETEHPKRTAYKEKFMALKTKWLSRFVPNENRNCQWWVISRATR